MRKRFSLGVILLLAFILAACGQDATEENGTNGSVEMIQAAVIETAPSDESPESVEEPAVSDKEESEPSAEEEIIMKAELDFETRTVTLNSGYEIPINGLGTYSLHGEECISSVKSALSNGVRLIDTASAYGNEEEVGQAVREAIDEGIIRRGDVFVTTKIYPGDEMKNPAQSIQACIDRLDIGYVDARVIIGLS